MGCISGICTQGAILERADLRGADLTGAMVGVHPCADVPMPCKW